MGELGDSPAEISEPPPPAPAGSAARGIMAAVVAAVAAVPLTAIAGLVCLVLERVLLGKVLGHRVGYHEMKHDSTAMMGASVVAAATGLFGGGAASAVALMLVKDAARRTFYYLAGAAYLALAAALWLWLRQRDPAGVAGNSFYVLLGWIGAVIGLLVAGATDGDTQTAAAPPDPVV